MNKKDVEHIGYILSCAKCREELLGSLFEWDPRIKEEYEMFEMANGRSEEVDRKTEELMIERYGHNWAILRKKPPYAEVLDEVRRNVYGNDYHPSLFK